MCSFRATRILRPAERKTGKEAIIRRFSIWHCNYPGQVEGRLLTLPKQANRASSKAAGEKEMTN